MAIVTDLQYRMENRLIQKLDIMIERCRNPEVRKDAVLQIEGPEGEGKTNSSCAVAYYIKHKTKRDIHLFFRLEGMIKLAQNTKEKIIIWDEPALDALSSDWYKEINKNLIRLLMAVRKNRHFFIFNFTKFYKFTEYIVVDRCLGMIHMYSRNEVEPGKFVYIKKRNLERLYLGWRISKKRLYKELTAFHGSFPEVMNKYFDKMGIILEGKPNATLEDYEKEKDKAIQSIGGKEEKKESNVHYIRLKELKVKIGSMKLPIKNKDELAAKLGLTRKTIYSWSKTEPIPEEIDEPLVV